MTKFLNEISGSSFENFFLEHYQLAVVVAYKVVNDKDIAEDITQEVFIKLWHKKDSFTFNKSLKPYLLQAVKNSSLNYIRDNQITEELEGLHLVTEEEYDHEKDELIVKLLEKIKSLPAQCQNVFRLVCLKDLSYQQAADQLGISKNTVKTQMGKAYRILREKMDIGLLHLFFKVT